MDSDDKSTDKTTLLKYFTPSVSMNFAPRSDSDPISTKIVAKNRTISSVTGKHRSKSTFQQNLRKISSEIIKSTKLPSETKKISSETMKSKKIVSLPLVEINSEESSDDDDQRPVKKLIVKNSANFNPDVFVEMLPPERVALLTKTTSKFDGEIQKITVVNLSSDDSDDEPIAKKFSPCGENVKNLKQKTLSKQIPEKKASSTIFGENKVKPGAEKRKSPSSLTVKEKLQLSKKSRNKSQNVGAKPKTGNIFSNCKPKSVATRTRTDSSSSLEDTLPLSEVSKILSTRTCNDPQSSEKGNFLNPSKTNREQRFKTTVAKLEKLKTLATEKPQRAHKKAYASFAQQVINVPLLNETELKQISNQILRKDMLFRFEREKLKKMSEEEKKAYYRKKHSDEAERRKQTVQSEKERFEDCDIADKSALPTPEPVKILNKDFGSLLMVAEFAKTFVSFFSPENKFEIDLGLLLNALTKNSDGFELLGKILTTVMEILLQEKCPMELNTSIDEIEVNIYTAAELARLYLVKWSSKNEKSEDSDEIGSNSSFGEIKLGDDLAAKLEVEDFYNLSAEKKLEFLTALIHDLLQTQKFEDLLKEKEDQLAEAWKEKFEASAELKKYKTIEAPKTAESLPNINASSLKQFYGDAAIESNENKSLNSELVEEDDMIYKVKHRRLLAQKDKEKEKLEKEKSRKEYEMSQKVTRVENANKNFERLQLLTKLFFRYLPLGNDRNHSRYWYFPGVSPYLFVEKGWTSAYDDTVSNSVTGSPKKSFASTTFPSVEENSWFFYDSNERINDLISSLMPKGVRESRLKESLLKKQTEIKTVYESYLTRSDWNKNSLKAAVSSEDADAAELLSKEFLRKEIFSAECKIREGGLGGSDDFDDFKSRLEAASSLKDFASLLIEVQKNVRPSLLSGMMAVKKSVRRIDDTANENDSNEEDKQNKEEKKPNNFTDDWRTAVDECRTWSRIFVLLYMFKNCVMWDKSIENARCNKCRKNKDDNKVILCEICNAGYHIYCLRPPLKKIPDGDWFCERCQPPSSRTRHRVREEEIEESEDSDEESIQHDDVCVRCSQGQNDDLDELVVCATCPSAFHKPCHEPPLRHTPRLGWRCCQCTKGIVIKRNLRKRKIR